MRLLVYYNPNKDIFVTNYFEDRHHPVELLTYNCYGNLVIQYIYIEDHKVFWNYQKYKKYVDKKLKIGLRKRYNIRYKLGQKIIKLGRYISFGKEEKVKVVYVYKYPWWKNK